MKRGYRFSVAAARDLVEIGTYTQQTWGVAQRRVYLNRLQKCFETLSVQPKLGKSRSELPGMRGFHHDHHVIFYMATPDDILIVRVLHERQDPTRHLK